MSLKKISVVGTIATLLIVAMAITAVVPVSAWHWGSFAGHPTIVSDLQDVPSVLRPYIQRIEYDAVCGPRMGARLYLTFTGGCYAALSYNNAYILAQFVTSQCYWIGDRNTQSVAYEIKFHCPVKYWQIDIEYYYRDLTVNRPPIVY
jgi:hypothetical protein